MGRMTHRLLFITFFAVGGAFFSFAFWYQVPGWTAILQNIIKWIVPFGMAFLIIGGTGMVVTSKRQLKKKLKQMDEYLGDADEELEQGQSGEFSGSFSDYLTSPEQAITVYTFFIVGVLIFTWGLFNLFGWIGGFL
jgi:hypothetical protein